MRVSGCNGYYKFVLGPGARAKSVTNNLSLLSVLAYRLNKYFRSLNKKFKINLEYLYLIYTFVYTIYTI